MSQMRRKRPKRYGLAVDLLIADLEVAARLIDVTYAGIEVGLTSTRVLLRLDQQVLVRFHGPGLAGGLPAPTVVHSRTPDGRAIRYRLAFERPEELQRKMPARYLGAFNRRAAFRIGPDSGKPVMAHVVRNTSVSSNAPPVELDLPLISVSTTGLAIRAKAVADRRLMSGDCVTLTFTLPEEHQSCELIGTVIYETKGGGAVSYGVQFNLTTPYFTRYQTQIGRYVMCLQRRSLQNG
jgi:hypothetical protein